MAFIGKNASGKTSAIDLLDCAYSILSEFRLENKKYSYDGIELEIIFYHDDYIYRYETTLSSDKLGNRAIFKNEKVFRKKYFKTNVKEIYNTDTFEKVQKGLFPLVPSQAFDDSIGDDVLWLPDDTSRLFYILGKKETRAIYFDSYEDGTDTYRLMFNALKNYDIEDLDYARQISDSEKSILSS